VTNSIESQSGAEYLQFAKSGSWGRDLYDDFVAPTLGAGLAVETWRLGAGGRMGSVCNSSQGDDYWQVGLPCRALLCLGLLLCIIMCSNSFSACDGYSWIPSSSTFWRWRRW
jgi:hypothetical protein